jgi:two-component system, OmpR family, phosphate regulon sensor histidine kinase PhoR
MLEALPFPAVLIDQNALVESSNAGAAALLGPGLQGRSFDLFIRQPALLAAIASARAGGEPEPVSLPGDPPFLVHVRRSKSGVLVMWQDQSEADALGRMRRDFVANVSHELRTPLTSLMGFVETLQGVAGDDPAARGRFLSIMDREARRMNRLIGDLLSLSTVEANERVRPRDPIALATLVQTVLQRMTPQSHGGRLVTDLAEIPEIPGDADQLGQAIANLVENALRYGKRGGDVIIKLGEIDDPILMRRVAALSVEDQGDGIPAHHIPRLTERFYRVDNHRSRELGGTGLGLAIVKHIITRHRGRLKIESQPQKGSVFTILLPLS